MARKPKTQNAIHGWEVLARVWDTLSLFGGHADKNLKVNYFNDGLMTVIALAILYITYPMIKDLDKLPNKGAIELAYVLLVLYNLPYKAIKDCRELFLKKLQRNNVI